MITHAVTYFSKKSLPRKQKSTIEECLAEIEAFQVYLATIGKEFTIQTDLRALQWFTKFKDTLTDVVESGVVTILIPSAA